MSENLYLTRDELSDIKNLIDDLNARLPTNVSFDVSVYDCNGERLGVVTKHATSGSGLEGEYALILGTA